MDSIFVFWIAIAFFGITWWLVVRTIRKGGPSSWVMHTAGISVGTVAFLVCVLILSEIEGERPVEDAVFIVTTLIILSFIIFWAIKAIRRSLMWLLKSKRLASAHHASQQKIADEITKIRGFGNRLSKTYKDAALKRTKPKKATKKHIYNHLYSPQFRISYVDAHGDYSERNITIHSATKTRIQAYCHEKEGERTFLVNRVQEGIIDLETGEVLSRQRWVNQIS